MGTGSVPWINIYRDSTDFKWIYRFVWWPKRSEESGRRIWFKKAWYGYRLVWGPAGEDPVRIERWLTDEEYVWYQLTGE